VAQPDRLDFGVIIYRPGDNRHRVWCNSFSQASGQSFFHVAADVQHRRYMPRSVKNAAGVDRIAPAQFDAVKMRSAKGL